jgi:hypothetical protein
MEILDEDGNLFGAVNILDALAVLLVLAVVVGSVSLVFGGDGSDRGPSLETTHVTLDLGKHPTYIASEINAGDTHSAGGDSQLTLTDVYFAPESNGTRVIVRAELRAPVRDNSISYSNAPLRLGRTLQIATSRYQVSGQIRAVGEDDTLAHGEAVVVLQAEMGAADARDVTSGDEIRLGERTIAIIEEVTEYATENPDRKRMVIGVSLQTLVLNGQDHFGAVPIQQGTELTLSTGEYTISGPVQHVGTTKLPGSVTTRTVRLRMSNVREDMANAIQTGMTEQSRNVTFARVTDVEVEPSLLITTGQDGLANVTEHPTDREVVITAELRVRETASGVQFKGQSVRQGSKINIDLRTIIVRGSVIEIRS